jgi:thiol-disulfide isomerase/thioredoxin
MVCDVHLRRISIQENVKLRIRRRRFLRTAAAAVGLAGYGELALGQEPTVPIFRSGRFQFTLLRPQQTLPAIRLFRIDGKTTQLSSLLGRPALINFWASWCEACQIELPILDRLYTESRHTGLQVIAIAGDKGGRPAVERFIAKYKIRNLPIYLDPNGYAAYSDSDNRRNAPFAVHGIPVTYAVAASGWVVGYMSGAADWASEGAERLIEFLRHS